MLTSGHVDAQSLAGAPGTAKRRRKKTAFEEGGFCDQSGEARPIVHPSLDALAYYDTNKVGNACLVNYGPLMAINWAFFSVLRGLRPSNRGVWSIGQGDLCR